MKITDESTKEEIKEFVDKKIKFILDTIFDDISELKCRTKRFLIFTRVLNYLIARTYNPLIIKGEEELRKHENKHEVQPE